MSLPSLSGLCLDDRRAASTGKLATVYASTWHTAFAHEIRYKKVMPEPRFEVRYKLKDGEFKDKEITEFLREVGKQLEKWRYFGCYLDEKLTIPLTATKYAEPTDEMKKLLIERFTKEAMDVDGPKLYLEGDYSQADDPKEAAKAAVRPRPGSDSSSDSDDEYGGFTKGYRSVV